MVALATYQGTHVYMPLSPKRRRQWCSRHRMRQRPTPARMVPMTPCLRARTPGVPFCTAMAHVTVSVLGRMRALAVATGGELRLPVTNARLDERKSCHVAEVLCLSDAMCLRGSGRMVRFEPRERRQASVQFRAGEAEDDASHVADGDGRVEVALPSDEWWQFRLVLERSVERAPDVVEVGSPNCSGEQWHDTCDVWLGGLEACVQILGQVEEAHRMSVAVRPEAIVDERFGPSCDRLARLMRTSLPCGRPSPLSRQTVSRESTGSPMPR